MAAVMAWSDRISWRLPGNNEENPEKPWPAQSVYGPRCNPGTSTKIQAPRVTV